MVMSWIWTLFLLFSVIISTFQGRISNVSAAVAEGAQAGITLAISMAGSICLWSGVGHLMDKAGMTDGLSCFMPDFPRYKDRSAASQRSERQYLR